MREWDQRVFRLKRHLAPRIHERESLFLLGGENPLLLRDATFAGVVALLDGERTTAEIVDRLAGQFGEPEVFLALMRLRFLGYVVEVGQEPYSTNFAAFWEAQAVGAQRAHERLARTAVRVHAESEELEGSLTSALRAANIRVKEHASLAVVVVDDYLDPTLPRWSAAARDQGLSWLLVKLTGTVAWLGPLFEANGGFCWACMAQRLRLNRPVEVYLERQKVPEVSPRVLPTTRASVQLAAHWVAQSIALWIVQSDASLALDRLWTFNPVTATRQEHFVSRYPQCEVCGDADGFLERGYEPLRLMSRPKRFIDDGGHRGATPEHTWERLSRQISPLTGVVSSIGPVAGRDHPQRPVYGAAYRTCPWHGTPSHSDFHRVAMGKGRTPAQARVSALCEAIERHSMGFRGDEPRRRGRVDQLDARGIRPNALQNFSDAQFQGRERHAADPDVQRRIPRPFDPSVVIDWTPVWSLTHRCRRWVPTSYCFAGMPVPEEERFCYANANGHAAGNTLEEAILQAFLELVERDAVAIWWYNRLERPSVDLGSFEQRYFEQLLLHYEELGYSIWVLDLTTDLEIPAFVALAMPTGEGRWHMGFGCHVDAPLAIQRALTEVNQLFDPSLDAPAPWDIGELTDPSFLFAHQGLGRRCAGDYPADHNDDLRDDVSNCVSRAARLGLETLVLDQTRPDTDLHVVKVIVPGLRHFWPRFGPGRLYDVPVSLGLRARSLSEQELNPATLRF